MIKRLTVWAAAAVMMATVADAQDRHAGYYYPTPEVTEEYEGRAQKLPEASKRVRLAFVTAMTAATHARPYPPSFAIFAKGTDSEKMIIVSLQSGRYDTVFRMRALLAMLTAMARATPILQDRPDVELLTFLDLCYMMGFTQITVTDGDNVAYQIVLR